MRSKKFFSLLLLLLLAGCRTEQPGTSIPTLPTAELQPAVGSTTPQPDSTPVPTAPPPPFTERPQYTFSASLDYDKHQLEVNETIVYPNHSGTDIDQLVLVVEPQRDPGSFNLHSMKLNSQPVSDYILGDGKLSIPLDIPLGENQAVKLDLQYTLLLPGRNGPLGYTKLQANFHDWYPFFPPYRAGEGWVIHPPGSVGEHLVYPSVDFEVHITNRDKDITIAAPHHVGSEGDTEKYQLERARAFMWSASPYWAQSSADESGVPVHIYYYPEHEKAADKLLSEVGKALTLYQKLFGPYPFDDLTIVAFDSHDAMESDALFFISYTYFESFDDETLEFEPKLQNYLIIIGVHETCHNWWYSQVGNDQAMEPWLDESLCVYCEQLFYERTYPEMSRWWWDYRVRYFKPEGSVNSTIYQFDEYRQYVSAVYLRGVMMVHEIRITMGDKAFFAALRDYAEQGRGRVMSWDDFLEILGQYSDKDLSPVLEKFFSP